MSRTAVVRLSARSVPVRTRNLDSTVMIIELFGPPGSGKTTFARELARHLCERGYQANVVLSYQPRVIEDTSNNLGAFQFLFRVIVTASNTLYTIINSPFRRDELKTSMDLVKCMRPTDIFWRIRIWQYILNLSRRWREARKSDDIIIFDQGFVQAVGSLALFNGTPNDASLTQALELAPSADVSIRLLAPREVVETRLRERMGHIPKAQRLLEAGISINLSSFDIFNDIQRILSLLGKNVVSVQPVDQESTAHSIHSIESIIETYLQNSNGLHPFKRMRASRAIPADA